MYALIALPKISLNFTFYLSIFKSKLHQLTPHCATTTNIHQFLKFTAKMMFYKKIIGAVEADSSSRS